MNSIGVNQHNIVSSEEAINIIKTSVQTLLNKPELADCLPPICMHGAPGVGKSAICKGIAEELNIGFVDVRLAQMERCDLLGVPVVEKGVTKWNVPDFWPKADKKGGILFFDELTSASPDCQVAAYSVILDRKIPNTDYVLPNNWFIVAAGNRKTDRAVVKAMSSALANRFLHIEVEANAEDWNMWAVAHDIHPSVTGFIKFRPDKLFDMDPTKNDLEQAFPTPRAWEKVANIIPLFGENEDVLRKVVYGLVGPGVGLEFVEFHRLNKKMADVEEWLTNPKAKIEIPTKADELCATIAAIPYLLWNAKNEKELSTRISGFYRIIMKLDNAFAMLLAKTALQGNSKISKIQAMTKILTAKEYADFKKKYGDELSKTYTI